MASLQVDLVRWHAGNILSWSAAEVHPKCRCDCLGNFVLNRENVRYMAVVALGPKVGSIVGGNELGAYADARACFPYTPLENILNTQGLRDNSDVFLLPFEGKCRSTRDHLQSGDVRQFV